VRISNSEVFDLWEAWKRQRRVMFALMLQSIRARFFGNGLGYLVAVAWPLCHIVILVVTFSLLRRATPYGSSTSLFLATGVVPFMTFSYLSRMMMFSIIRGRGLLAFPEVRVLDLVLASAALETLAACLVAFVIVVIGWFSGVDVAPISIVDLCYAFAATLLLGLGMGFFNCVIVLAFPPWFTGYTLIIILLWVSSGVFFVPDALPDFARNILAYHPVLQCIEWTRSAYYEGYGDVMLNRPYPIVVGTVALFLGLGLERAVRGHILARR